MIDQSLIAEPIEGYEQVLAIWPFLLEGLDELNKTVKNGHAIRPEKFLKVHLDVATGAVLGIIVKVLSKNEKPLGFITAFENSVAEDYPTVCIYACYSNNKCAGMTQFAYNQVESWARAKGFVEIQAFSGRTSGASIRWFRRFGLELSKLAFVKKL